MDKYIPNLEEFSALNEKQRMIQGLPYKPWDVKLSSDRLKARQLIQDYNTSPASEVSERKAMLNTLLGSVKDSAAFIEPPFRVDYGYNIHLGKNVCINFNCIILDVASITIGDNAMIGPNVHIYAATHPLEADLRLEFELGKEVVIGDDVWIGGNVTICPGVKIGSRVVIGAGSVVTKDVESDVVVAGNPARVIKRLK